MIKKGKKQGGSCPESPDRKNFGRKVRWNTVFAAVLIAALLLGDIPGSVKRSRAMSAEMRQEKNEEDFGTEILSENIDRSEKEAKTETEAGEKAEAKKRPRSENRKETEFFPEQETMPGAQTENRTEKANLSEPESEIQTESDHISETEKQAEQDTEQNPETPSESEDPEETEAETENQTETEGQTETGTETETEGQTETGTETETESESQTDIEIEMESQAEIETETEIESESQTDIEVEMESQAEIETETETESESQTDIEVEMESQAEIETETESEGQTDIEIEVESQAEIETETESESESQADIEIEVESQAEIKTEAGDPAGTGAETESQTEDEMKPEDQPETEMDPGAEIGNEAESPPEKNDTANPEDPAGTGTKPKDEIQPGSDDTGKDKEEEKPKEKELLKGESKPKEQKKGKDFQTEAPEESQTKTQSSWTGIAEEWQETPENGGKKEKQAVRGQDYEIQGDEGAWYRDTKDRLWVRKGSGLTAAPVGNRYNQGSRKTVLGGDGVFHFNLKQVDENGSIRSESSGIYETYYVDGEVPAASIAVDGNRAGNQIFSQTGTVSITAPPDAQSGLKQTSYQIIPCDENGADTGMPQDAGAWVSCGSLDKISLNEEGFYRVYARTEDRVGNVSISKSEVLCVDRTMPELVVEGIQDQTANSGEVAFKVQCSDKRYQTGSLQVRLVGLNNGIEMKPLKKKERKGSAAVMFGDFPRERKYDDIYLLTVRAQDIAGNVSEKSMRFSVNRCGSVYGLNEKTKENMQKYYVQEPFDVLISETNIDYVGESKIFCRRDGILHELVKGQDYQVILEGQDDSWKQYQYQINRDVFNDEGVYELLLTSRDKANNSSDTGVQQKRMTFAVDRTPPSCLISGIEEQGIYKAKKRKISVHAEDNICLKTMKIYRDGEVWKELSAAELEEAGGVVELNAKEKNEWQTLQVYLEDACGNTYQSREMPFYLSAHDIPEYETGVISRKTAAGEAAEKRTSGSIFTLPESASKTEYGMAVLLAGILSLLSVLAYCGFSGIKRKG